MRYFDAPDLKERVLDIVKTLGMNYIDVNRVGVIRSRGSSTRRTLARCHALSKALQKAMGVKAYYVIEFLEPFDKLSKDEQDKVIIHELMHIPKAFGGGFRQHDFVNERNVEVLHKRYVVAKMALNKKENFLIFDSGKFSDDLSGSSRSF